jgi:hypothetical protein
MATDGHRRHGEAASAHAQVRRPWWDPADPPWWAPGRAWDWSRLAGDDQPVTDPACEDLAREFRLRCPGLHPGYAPGELAQPIRVEEQEFRELLLAAVTRDAPARRFVWRRLDSELLVDALESRVALLEGLVLVGLRTRCAELGDAELVLPVAVGTETAPAGLVMAGEPVARGPELLVEVWGEAAVAAVWLALVDACRVLAARAGEDRYCEPLLPGAAYAQPGLFTVIPQARHAIDRAAAR